jgi:hypothetical protein
VNPWGLNDPDTQTLVAGTVVFLILFGLTIYRFTAKRERARAAQHQCPPPSIQFVERQYNPWSPLPWVRVDGLDEDGTP